MAPEQARDTRQASVASDMFSLGATLAFAATGHAPYQGETVMDVLVKLATEPPDLSGLPAELDGIITACLARSPGQRPTSAALLGQLGPFVATPAGPRSAHAYLPAPAMAVIGGYQHGPRQAVRAPADGDGAETGRRAHGENGHGAGGDTTSGGAEATGDSTGSDGDEATFGSQVALPAAPVNGRPLERAGQIAGVAPAAPPARHRRRLALIVAAVVTAAAALVAAGAIVGTQLAGTGNVPRPAASTPGALNPPLGPPPSVFPAAPSGSPHIAVLQPVGDPATVFLLHGTGWAPLTRVTVTLARRGGPSVRSPIRPVVDLQGTFNYAINQGHEFSARGIPPGVYDVVVTGPGGRQSRAHFQVHPMPPGQGLPS
jgi:hypothetical protein